MHDCMGDDWGKYGNMVGFKYFGHLYSVGCPRGGVKRLEAARLSWAGQQQGVEE
jgi:hypothetical protein